MIKKYRTTAILNIKCVHLIFYVLYVPHKLKAKVTGSKLSARKESTVR